MIRILVFVAFLSVAWALSKGIVMRASSRPSDQTWQCLAGSEYKNLIVIPAFEGGLGINRFFTDHLTSAEAAGFSSIGVSVFGCPKCKNNKEVEIYNQVAPRIKSLRVDMIWIRIESCPNCWHNATDRNIAYIDGLVTLFKNLNKPLGIMTSMDAWNAIAGPNSGVFSQLKLYYVKKDNKPDFHDEGFYDIGSWKAASVKEYGLERICNQAFPTIVML